MKRNDVDVWFFHCSKNSCGFTFYAPTELSKLYCPRCAQDTAKNQGKAEIKFDKYE
jgi:hypothetical protein